MRLFGLNLEGPTHFSRGLVGFFVVAPHARSDEVLPRVCPSTGFGVNVIDCVGHFSAIRASMVVTSKHSSSRQWHTLGHGHLHVTREDDDIGSLPQSADSKHGMVSFVAERHGFTGHDENNRSAIRHDSERFIAGVEDKRFHEVPFVPAWRAGCRVGPSRLAVKTQKALSYGQCLGVVQSRDCVTVLGHIG